MCMAKAEYGALVAEVEHIESPLVLTSKRFSTGSDGFQGIGKVTIDGVRYQANFMLVRIGSKLENQA